MKIIIIMITIIISAPLLAGRLDVIGGGGAAAPSRVPAPLKMIDCKARAHDYR